MFSSHLHLDNGNWFYFPPNVYINNNNNDNNNNTISTVVFTRKLYGIIATARRRYPVDPNNSCIYRPRAPDSTRCWCVHPVYRMMLCDHRAWWLLSIHDRIEYYRVSEVQELVLITLSCFFLSFYLRRFERAAGADPRGGWGPRGDRLPPVDSC